MKRKCLEDYFENVNSKIVQQHIENVDPTVTDFWQTLMQQADAGRIKSSKDIANILAENTTQLPPIIEDNKLYVSMCNAISYEKEYDCLFMTNEITGKRKSVSSGKISVVVRDKSISLKHRFMLIMSDFLQVLTRTVDFPYYYLCDNMKYFYSFFKSVICGITDDNSILLKSDLDEDLVMISDICTNPYQTNSLCLPDFVITMSTDGNYYLDLPKTTPSKLIIPSMIGIAPNMMSDEEYYICLGKLLILIAYTFGYHVTNRTSIFTIPESELATRKYYIFSTIKDYAMYAYLCQNNHIENEYKEIHKEFYRREQSRIFKSVPLCLYNDIGRLEEYYNTILDKGIEYTLNIDDYTKLSAEDITSPVYKSKFEPKPNIFTMLDVYIDKRQSECGCDYLNVVAVVDNIVAYSAIIDITDNSLHCVSTNEKLLENYPTLNESSLSSYIQSIYR